MKYLFVGGPKDGCRETIDPQPCVKVHELLPVRLGDDDLLDPNQVISQNHFYYAKRFVHYPHEPHLVYFHSSLEDADSMAILLRGYKA